LRYTDPSGHYSEEFIKNTFGVETWKEVLAFFEKGGKLEGRWGWLETLRQAQNGDELQFSYLDLSGKVGFANGEFTGGKLILREAGEFLSGLVDLPLDLLTAGLFGESYTIWRNGINPQFKQVAFSTNAYAKHLGVRVHTSEMDWGDIALDATGLLADLTVIGAPVGRLTNLGFVQE
jgi:hypothetical protein